MMVPIQVIRWYRMQCYDGTDSCATVVPIRRYCQLNSKYGFHNNEENAPEWVVSDYASESDIVERFVTLTSIIIQQPEVILCQ